MKAYSKRNLVRINKSQQDLLKTYLDKFTLECLGKQQEEIKDIYKKYEVNWERMAANTNKTKNYIVYADQFQVAVDEFINVIPTMRGKVSPFIFHQYLRIYQTLKKRNVFQRIEKVLSKYFLRKSNG